MRFNIGFDQQKTLFQHEFDITHALNHNCFKVNTNFYKTPPFESQTPTFTGI